MAVRPAPPPVPGLPFCIVQKGGAIVLSAVGLDFLTKLWNLAVGTPAPNVADLLDPVTAGAGARSFVLDSTVTAAGNFGAVVGGGGAEAAPVYSDGTDWRIG